MFNSYYKDINIDIKDGQQVIISGGVSLYVPRGSYQLSVKKIKLSSDKGDIYKQYERLKKELSSEGLFNNDYKKIFLNSLVELEL